MVSKADIKLEAGTVVASKYELLGVIGEGGWARVYKALNPAIGKHVAIKLLHERFVDDVDKVARFRKEAELACSLSHPNLISVLDYGILEQNGQPYIVMELLEGRDLGELLEQSGGRVEWRRLVDILSGLCRGLSALHAAGLVHRDLKPSNILLLDSAGGEQIVKLLDFGLVRSASSDSLTATGEVLGTPLYMSPEQCRGLELNERSDLYALGCLAYQCLTGVHPFDAGTHVEIMYRHVHEQPAPFAERLPEQNLPDALEAIVFKLMEKEPEQRYQTALEVLADLQELTTANSAALRALVSRMSKRRRKQQQEPWRRWLFAALAGALAITAGVFAALILLHHNPPGPVAGGIAGRMQAFSFGNQPQAIAASADRLMRQGEVAIADNNWQQALSDFRRALDYSFMLTDDEGRVQICASKINQCRVRLNQGALTIEERPDTSAGVDRIVQVLKHHFAIAGHDNIDVYAALEISALANAHVRNGVFDKEGFARDVEQLNAKLHQQGILPSVDVLASNNRRLPIAYRGVTATGGRSQITTAQRTFHFDSAGHVEQVDGPDPKVKWIWEPDGMFRRYVDGQPTRKISWDVVSLDGSGDVQLHHPDGTKTIVSAKDCRAYEYGYDGTLRHTSEPQTYSGI